MWLFASILFLPLTLGDIFDVYKCVIDNRSFDYMYQEKLAHDLVDCGYEVFKPPPVNQTEPLKVTLRFTLKRFKYISTEQEFSIYAWAFVTWVDDRLKFDPKNYNGVDGVVLSTSHIWSPGIKVVNSISDIYDQRYFYSPCTVNSSGEVHCVTWINFQTKCVADLNNWPYDRQTCSLKLTPWKDQGIKVELNLKPRAITMLIAEYGAEWDIIDYQQKIDLKGEAQLTMTFTLERHAEVLAAIVIYPSVVLSTLTLLCLLIDARRLVRLYMIGFSLLCHWYFLSDLMTDTDMHGKSSPRLILYYRGSVIMTTCALILTLTSALLCCKETDCPNWVISVNSAIHNSIVSIFIWPRWSTEVEDVNTFPKDWTNFANIINCMWIVVSIIVYVILYCVFVPQPLPPIL